MGALTKADGSYEFLNIPPGRYRVMVARVDNRGVQGAPEAKFVDVAAKESATVHFKLPPLAQISGRVLNANRQPVPNVEVTLLNIAYGQGISNPGSLIYPKTHLTTTTNDLGEYSLSGIEPDHQFLLYVDAPLGQVRSAVADTPAEPAQRRPILAPTFFPNAIAVTGAERLRLRAGEDRENADIRMVSSPSYCVSGTAAGAAETPSVLTVTSLIPASGSYSDQVTFRRWQQYDVPATGAFRICGLSPYPYTLYVAPKAPNNPGGYYASADFTITDKDVINVPVIEQRPIDLKIETVMDGQTQAPQGQLPSMSIAFGPTRGSNTGAAQTTVTIPGTTVVKQLRPDAYRLLPRGLPAGTYIKEVTYGNKPHPNDSFAPSSDASMVLKLVIARDGGSVIAHVADRNGPIPGITTLLIPSFKSQPADLSHEIFECPTQADGSCRNFRLRQGGATPGPMAPGKYYILAVNLPYNPAAETFEALARALPKAKTVTIEPKGTVEITIEPTELR
jgi:hypothetical protein